MKEQLQIKPTDYSQCNLVVTDGGVGDLICELVAVDYNIRNFPSIKFHVWVPDYMLDLTKHLLPKESLVRPFSKARDKFKQDIDGRTTEWCTNHTAMRTHPVDYGFHMLSDRHVYDLNKKNYLQIRPDEIKILRFHLPKKYVVLVAAAAEPVKEMPAKTANEIIEFCLSKGYAPVFLGKEKSDTGLDRFSVTAKPIDLDYHKGINLLNKTNLLEAAKIMSGAKAVIGMDGGLIHLAGCTDTAIVAGYTLVDPAHVAPIRKGSQTYKFHAIEPDKDILNRYYQTYSGFKREDCRKFSNWESVITDMTSDKFISILENVL